MKVHFLSLFSSPQHEVVLGLLACSLPGPRKWPPTQHRAACYSSVCPRGAWTPGYKPHLTLGQSCLSLLGADTSLAASGCLHHSSVCKETTTLPSICERKAKRSGSRYVPPSAGSLVSTGLYVLDQRKITKAWLIYGKILESAEFLSLP